MTNPRIHLPGMPTTLQQLSAAIALHERLNFQKPTCLRVHPVQYVNALSELSSSHYAYYGGEALNDGIRQRVLEFFGVQVWEDHRVQEGTVQVGYVVEFE